MANIGTRQVVLLKPMRHLEAGRMISASIWQNLDSYTDCAEVKPPDQDVIPLGRITDGGWRYATPTEIAAKQRDRQAFPQ